jgi:hypothetical protein
VSRNRKPSVGVGKHPCAITPPGNVRVTAPVKARKDVLDGPLARQYHEHSLDIRGEREVGSDRGLVMEWTRSGAPKLQLVKDVPVRRFHKMANLSTKGGSAHRRGK